MTTLRFPQVFYTPGQVIYAPGDISDHLYMIKLGNVRLVDSDGTDVAVHKEGETFGVHSVLTGSLRLMSAIAINHVTCIEIPSEVVKKMLEQKSELVSPIFKALVLQLHMRNAMAGKNGLFRL
jgi:CRP-like cAMP-binding protein|tara:strand:- start:13 stop:381 length:369 start_codon:yes stop_codon:yes gene_type:complete